MSVGGRGQEAPTIGISAQSPAGPPPAPNRPPAAQAPPVAPTAPINLPPIAQPPIAQPTAPIAQQPGTPEPPPAPPVEPQTIAEPAAAPKETGGRVRGFLRDPLAVVLVIITVLALALAGVIAAELIARRIADSKVAAATACVVDDKVTVSFGVTPPFLWQHITGHYTNISIATAGNQLKEAEKMQADLNIYDVRLHTQGDSKGTIGALDAAITWPTVGIKGTIQKLVPVLGGLISDVKTNAADGTVELKGLFGLGEIVVKPEVVDGGLSLQVEKLSGLGTLTLPRETVQPELDRFAAELTKKYPLGIHADSVQVTDTGVKAHFSTRNASIPDMNNPCFKNL